jgi:hypothetical protein
VNPEAFYVPGSDENTFVATELTRGPWDPGSQHAGPAAALLGSLIEKRHPREGMQVARMTVEILRSLPIAPVTVTTQVLRGGRSVELLGGSLAINGTEVARANVWRIRTVDALPFESNVAELAPPVPPAPTVAHPSLFFPTGQAVGYHTAMEVVFVKGNFTELGPATAWARMRVPLVAGEAITPLVRVLVIADSGNGLSASLDYRRFLFVNPDLSVYLHRLPAGEWIGLDSRTFTERHGIGLAESVLFDETGSIGRGLQSLFIAVRAGTH